MLVITTRSLLFVVDSVKSGTQHQHIHERIDFQRRFVASFSRFHLPSAYIVVPSSTQHNLFFYCQKENNQALVIAATNLQHSGPLCVRLVSVVLITMVIGWCSKIELLLSTTDLRLGNRHWKLDVSFVVTYGVRICTTKTHT